MTKIDIALRKNEEDMECIGEAIWQMKTRLYELVADLIYKEQEIRFLKEKG